MGNEGWLLAENVSQGPKLEVSELSTEEKAARNYAHRFDNVKFLLTHAVALHHFVSLYSDVYGAMLPRVYGYWVEWFLMPVYCFMSGTLTSVESNARRSQAIFSRFTYPHLKP